MAFQNVATPVNSTQLTMHERFSNLPQQVQLTDNRRGLAAANVIRPGSARNRKLAEQLERRLSTQTALKLKKKSIRQRLGRGLKDVRPVVERLGVPIGPRGGLGGLVVGRGRGRRRGRGGAAGLRRSQSVQSLQRVGSVQSLTGVGVQQRGRSRSRSRSRLRMDRSLSRGAAPNGAPRGRTLLRMDGAPADGIQPRGRSRSRGRAPNTQPGILRRGRSRSRGNLASNQQLSIAQRIGRARGRAGARSRSRNRVPIQTRGGIGGRNNAQQSRRGRSAARNPGATRGGRGRGRGLGRGRGRGRGQNPAPSRDELDKQLDQYMASSREDGDTAIKTDVSWP